MSAWKGKQKWRPGQIRGEERKTFPCVETDRVEGMTYPELDMIQARTFMYISNVEHRDYQLQISRAAVQANTLVILPTGLGKTFIAAMIILNYFRWFPTGKIVFVAPTKPLVRQQMDAILNKTQIPRDMAVEITGVVQAKMRMGLWASKSVFFATPQSVQHDIKNKACPAAEIVLVIIDEAHNARGDHSYCLIVRDLVAVTRFVRIVGLSATPGRAFEDVQNVIYNLMIEKLECRTEGDCKEYSHVRDVKSIVVPDAPGVIELSARLNALLYVHLKELLRQSLVQHMDPTRTSKGMLARILKQGVGSVAMKSLRAAIGLTGLREKLEGFGVPVFVRELAEFIQRPDRVQDEQTGELSALLDAARCVPQVDLKLEKLTEIVVDFIHSSQRSKMIVFCFYRKIVVDIVEQLNKASGAIKCVAFIGQSSSADVRGLNQKNQLRIMDDFKRGVYNVLVSTSIGEEGLDIGEVDFIVCYDVQKSPIRTIQRMGRTGRHRDGQVLFMLSEATKGLLSDKGHPQDAISNLITRRRNDFEFYKSERMNPHEMEVIYKRLEYNVAAPVPITRRDTKRATLLGSELEEMKQKHGTSLQYRALSISEFTKFQAGTTSFTDVTFSGESVVLGEMISMIAQNDRFSVGNMSSSIFGIDASVSSPREAVPFSIPSGPRLSAPSSMTCTPADVNCHTTRKSDSLFGMLDIDVSTSSDSSDSLDVAPMRLREMPSDEDDLDGFLVHSSDLSDPVSVRESHSLSDDDFAESCKNIVPPVLFASKTTSDSSLDICLDDNPQPVRQRVDVLSDSSDILIEDNPHHHSETWTLRDKTCSHSIGTSDGEKNEKPSRESSSCCSETSSFLTESSDMIDCGSSCSTQELPHNQSDPPQEAVTPPLSVQTASTAAETPLAEILGITKPVQRKLLSTSSSDFDLPLSSE